MSVDDHGLEVLKKSAVQITPGDKSEYKIRTEIMNFSDISVFIDDIESLLTTIRNNADELEGFLNQVEGLISDSNTLLTSISGFTDGIEGLLTSIRDNADTVESKLQSIMDNTDTLESLITTTNTTLASIDSKMTSSSGSVTSVASSETSVTLLASNSSRKGFRLYNDSNQTAYVKFGATASSTSFTIKMASNEPYESQAMPNYTGIIDAIWNVANGSMIITELT